ncbi:MAG: smalltalk protein [Prevotella sp.]|nr:smalltalk protein [Prevotella sp.]
MSKKTWTIILQTIANIIAAVLTALGTTSCMSYGGML